MDSVVFPSPAANHTITLFKALPNPAALAYSVLQNAMRRSTLLLVAVSDSHSAQLLEQDLLAFKPGFPILHFPDWETLSYDRFSPHPDLISQRIDCLYRLPDCRQGILVVPITSLMQRIAPSD